MGKNLTCNQVGALINFYLEGRLTPKLCEYIEAHLEICPFCRIKYEKMRKISEKYKRVRENSAAEQEEAPLAVEFVGNLSAYIDNELDFKDNIRVKKMTVSNPSAKKELETMYKFRRIMHSAYEKTKNESKYDYSKDILTKIYSNADYSTTYFYKLAFVFVALICLIIGGFVYLYS